MITINGVRCLKCKDIVYSRAGHDMRHCSCGESGVDGGQSTYGGRTTFKSNPPLPVTMTSQNLQLTDLLNDWRRGIDELGLIKSGTVELTMKIEQTTEETAIMSSSNLYDTGGIASKLIVVCELDSGKSVYVQFFHHDQYRVIAKVTASQTDGEVSAIRTQSGEWTILNDSIDRISISRDSKQTTIPVDLEKVYMKYTTDQIVEVTDSKKKRWSKKVDGK